MENEHLCYRCCHAYAIASLRGCDVEDVRTTQDENDCPCFNLISACCRHSEKGNDRTYWWPYVDDVTLKTVDNGMGYWVTKCECYLQAPSMKGVEELKRLVDDLIRKGVSPDEAVKNASYVVYAALGGEARTVVTGME